MPYYYYGFDWTYLVIVLPCLLLSMWASSSVNSTFNKYAKVNSIRRLTGAEAAQRVLSANGVRGVRIERVSGNLTDHYDPKTNVIRLSDSVHSSTSVAAIGVAAHEAGHAVQYAQNYGPIKLRAAIIPITNIGSKLAMPLFLLGLIFAGGSYVGGGIGETLMLTGILFFSFSTLFQLVTLPTEFNASSRAMKALEDGGVLAADELPAAKKTLSAAAMTYVAALATSLASLLRLILIFNGNRRQ